MSALKSQSNVYPPFIVLMTVHRFKPYLDSRGKDLYRNEAITNMDLIRGCYGTLYLHRRRGVLPMLSPYINLITTRFTDMHQGPPANPEVSPLLFSNRASLPPLVIFVSGLDPLSDECLLYERLLRQAGVSTKVFV